MSCICGSEAQVKRLCPASCVQVGDFHRTMLYGGIYGYPGDVKNKNGKLRLLYECAPMSMIAEQVRQTHTSLCWFQVSSICAHNMLYECGASPGL